jgi:hypothetical protein
MMSSQKLNNQKKSQGKEFYNPKKLTYEKAVRRESFP